MQILEAMIRCSLFDHYMSLSAGFIRDLLFMLVILLSLFNMINYNYNCFKGGGVFYEGGFYF